jgi:hypothetical protein
MAKGELKSAIQHMLPKLSILIVSVIAITADIVFSLGFKQQYRYLCQKTAQNLISILMD